VATDFVECPYPHCTLAEKHDSGHLAPLHLVQRFSYRIDAQNKQHGIHPGFCECKDVECTGTAVAVYAREGQRSIKVCALCEDALLQSGEATAEAEGTR
jgi:hypothetical protein